MGNLRRPASHSPDSSERRLGNGNTGPAIGTVTAG